MIYVSTSCVHVSSLQKCLDLLVGAGIRNIELSGGMSHQEDALDVLLEFKRKYTLNYLPHNYFPPPRAHFVLNIASHVSASRQRSLDFIRRSIGMCRQLGADRYMVHAGYRAELNPPTEGEMFEFASSNSCDEEKSWNLMLDSLEKMNVWGKREGIMIGLENLFPFGEKNSSLLTHFRDIRKFMQLINEKRNVGMLLDLGHLTLSANYFGFDREDVVDFILGSFPHKLLGIHLSENDGVNDLHLPMEKGCWQLQIIRKFRGFPIPITLESRNLDKEGVMSQYNLITSQLGEE